MKPDETKRAASPPQFSLRSLVILLTTVCVLLAVPGLLYLTLAISGWLLAAVCVIGFLVILQLPGYWFLRMTLQNAEGPVSDSDAEPDERRRPPKFFEP